MHVFPREYTFVMNSLRTPHGESSEVGWSTEAGAIREDLRAMHGVMWVQQLRGLHFATEISSGIITMIVCFSNYKTPWAPEKNVNSPPRPRVSSQLLQNLFPASLRLHNIPSHAKTVK